MHTTDFFSTYLVTDNKSLETWSESFTALDARFVRAPESAVTDGNGLNLEQASRFIQKMNSAQAAHKQEFTYSLLLSQ